jgi:hypothetical protein
VCGVAAVCRGILLALALCCASCSFGHGRSSTHRAPKIDWNLQRPVLESRQAWDEATGHKNEYNGFDFQPAR